MKINSRFVFDRNTIVSAPILPESTPRHAFDGALAQPGLQ